MDLYIRASEIKNNYNLILSKNSMIKCQGVEIE